MKSIKYIVIIFLGSFLIFKNLPIGDYCFGLLTGLISILLFGLLFIIVILFTIINIFKVSKKKEKFDIIPLILFIYFF